MQYELILGNKGLYFCKVIVETTLVLYTVISTLGTFRAYKSTSENILVKLSELNLDALQVGNKFMLARISPQPYP